VGHLALQEVTIERPSPAEVGTLSFEQVYREHSSLVYRFCLSLVRDPAEAEDVAAEVFVSALASYERTLPGPGEVRPWLLRIARNEVIDRDRRRRRRSVLLARFFSGRSEADPQINIEAQVLVRDELRGVLDAMRRLSARDRQLVGLRLAADLPYAEIAEVLGMSEHAVTVATRRALQKLRDHLGGRS
jgi:RNA polymerase sigma-70 factor (ECF subfamily)